MKKAAPPRPKKFPAAKQRRMDALLDKCGEGTLTPREQVQLDQLVAEAEQLMVSNAKGLATFSRRDGSRTNAVPVTVWVKSGRSDS